MLGARAVGVQSIGCFDATAQTSKGTQNESSKPSKSVFAVVPVMCPRFILGCDANRGTDKNVQFQWEGTKDGQLPRRHRMCLFCLL